MPHWELRCTYRGGGPISRMISVAQLTGKHNSMLVHTMTWRDCFPRHTGTHSKTPLIVSLVFIHSCVHTCSRIHRVPLFASDCHLRPQVFHCLLAVLKTFLSIQVTISHTASKEILISFVCNQGYGDSWVLGCTQPHGPRVWHHDKLMWHTECNQGYGDSWVLGCTQPHGPRGLVPSSLMTWPA